MTLSVRDALWNARRTERKKLLRAELRALRLCFKCRKANRQPVFRGGLCLSHYERHLVDNVIERRAIDLRYGKISMLTFADFTGERLVAIESRRSDTVLDEIDLPPYIAKQVERDGFFPVDLENIGNE